MSTNSQQPLPELLAEDYAAARATFEAHRHAALHWQECVAAAAGAVVAHRGRADGGRSCGDSSSAGVHTDGVRASEAGGVQLNSPGVAHVSAVRAGRDSPAVLTSHVRIRRLSLPTQATDCPSTATEAGSSISGANALPPASTSHGRARRLSLPTPFTAQSGEGGRAPPYTPPTPNSGTSGTCPIPSPRTSLSLPVPPALMHPPGLNHLRVDVSGLGGQLGSCSCPPTNSTTTPTTPAPATPAEGSERPPHALSVHESSSNGCCLSPPSTGPSSTACTARPPKPPQPPSVACWAGSCKATDSRTSSIVGSVNGQHTGGQGSVSGQPTGQHGQQPAARTFDQALSVVLQSSDVRCAYAPSPPLCGRPASPQHASPLKRPRCVCLRTCVCTCVHASVHPRR